ncbi:MAG: hypothetical protein F6K36_29890 [Symploca sp. SIO3C6]|nr:hypothetical protein [Symploca sp. SIO3C6]
MPLDVPMRFEAEPFQEQIGQTVTPKAGRVAIFQHKIRHEGCLVRQGTKYAMRTDVIYGKE